MRIPVAQLTALGLTPAMTLFAPCRFCGEAVVLGVNPVSGARTLAHAGDVDGKDGAQGQALISGCQPFRDLLATNPRELVERGKVQWRRVSDYPDVLE